MTASRRYFDELYKHDDPYGYRDRWYEARKRNLLLACLPRPRFSSAWEVGCSNGELTAALAPRCDALLATDLSPRAVELATARTIELGHVRVEQAAHPDQWPAALFDLIVFSEVGYFLSVGDLKRCAAGIGRSLTPLGTVIACHWRHAFTQSVQAGDAVHGLLDSQLSMHKLLAYRDDDILLDAWSPSALSVARHEGLA